MSERNPARASASRTTEIRGVIFDLGGVIVELERDSCEQRMEELLGHSYGPQQQAIVDRLQRGEIDASGFATELRDFAGRPELGDDEILAAWRLQIGAIPCERVQLMRRVRQAGYQTFILSTTNAPHIEEVQCRMQVCMPAASDPLRQSVDRAFLTFEMGMLKPEPEIYRAVIDSTGLRPGELLFLDDSPPNVLGAQAVGMRSLLVEGPGFVEWLPGVLKLSDPRVRRLETTSE